MESRHRSPQKRVCFSFDDIAKTEVAANEIEHHVSKILPAPHSPDEFNIILRIEVFGVSVVCGTRNELALVLSGPAVIHHSHVESEQPQQRIVRRDDMTQATSAGDAIETGILIHHVARPSHINE